MKNVPGMKYMVVLERQGWKVQRDRFGPVVASWSEAVQLCATAYREVAGGFNRILVLYADDEETLERLYAQVHGGGQLGATTFTTPDQADVNRHRIEDGEGGDHNVPYIFEMTDWLPMEVKWAEMLAKVERGQLGGENDGEERTTAND